MMMNALQVVRPGSFDRIRITIPELPSGKNDCVLVRTAWVSMCGSDIPFFTGNKRFRPYPLDPGAPIHECVGEVAESTSDLFRRGDKVLAIPEGDRGLAEYFIANVFKTIRLAPGINDPAAACVIQPLSTVLNAMDRLGDIGGKSFAIVGLGSIGLLFCWLAAKRGARSITGIDVLPERCRIAEGLGATRTICRNSLGVVHAARTAPGEWDAPDICIEAVGHQMDTVNDCLELVRQRGAVVAFGVPDHSVYALEYEIFFRKNAVLIASVTPDWAQYLSKAQELFLANTKELSSLITHRLPIKDAQQAFEMYAQHSDGIVKASLDACCW